MFGGLNDFNWADAVESTVSADLAKPPARQSAPKTEFDLLAETSRDGINLLFKNVMSMPVAMDQVSDLAYI